MFKPELVPGIKPGFNPRNRAKHFAMDRVVDHYAHISVEGAEHLETVQSILDDGNDVTIFANHGSNLDAPVLSRALDLSGYQDLEKKATYILGIKLKRNRGTAFQTGAYDHIVVVPKGYEPKNKKEKKEILDKQIFRKSISALKEAKENQRMIVVFPEGTRSRDGVMHEGLSEIASLVKSREDHVSYILPVGLEGVYEIYPPGQKLPNKGDVFVRIDEPIDVSSIEVPEDKERKQFIIDTAMTEVARLLPEEKRGFYESYVV